MAEEYLEDKHFHFIQVRKFSLMNCYKKWEVSLFLLHHLCYNHSNDPENRSQPLRKPQEYCLWSKIKSLQDLYFLIQLKRNAQKCRNRACCKSGNDFSGARKSFTAHQSEGPIIFSGTTSWSNSSLVSTPRFNAASCRIKFYKIWCFIHPKLQRDWPTKSCTNSFKYNH